MAINFPNSPSVGQIYTFNEKTWQWSGSYWEVYSAQTGYVTNAFNVGGANEIFSGKSGNDLYFRTISGGSNTTITTVGDVVKVDVTIPPDTNTFVTGFTYDNANTFTIEQNNGSNFSSSINSVTGFTINGDLLVTGTTNISGLTTVNSSLDVYNGTIGLRTNDYFLQGTSTGGTNVQLIGVFSNNEIIIGNQGYVNRIMDNTIINGELDILSGLTLSFVPTLNNSGTDLLVRNTTTGEIEYRPVSGITPDTNTFVTGSTVSANTLTISRNDLQNVLELSGGTNIQFIDNGNNSITLNATSGGGGASVSFPWKFKEPTTSGDPGNGQFRLNNSIASGITEIYVNDETNNGIDASNFLNILDIGDIIYIQQNDDASRALLFSVSASTIDNTGWFTIPVEYLQGSTIPKKDKICGWIFLSSGAEDNTVSNVGVGQGVFKQRNVNDFEFYSLSGGSNTTLSLNNDTIVIDVALPPSLDKFVSGGTYNDTTNNINFSGNSAETTFDVDLTSLVSSVSANTFVVAGNYSDSTDTISLLRNDGNFVNITGVTDTFVTGTTFGSNQAVLTRNDEVDVLLLTGGTNVTLSNPSTNQIKIDVNSTSTPLSVVSVTGTTYSATTSDDVIGFDTTSVTPTLFLPDSTSSGSIRYEVKDIGVNSRRNPITIKAAGSDTIITTSVVSSFELSADGGAVILVSTGSGQWWQM
jgi:hypothetical protein